MDFLKIPVSSYLNCKICKVFFINYSKLVLLIIKSAFLIMVDICIKSLYVMYTGNNFALLMHFKLSHTLIEYTCGSSPDQFDLLINFIQ